MLILNFNGYGSAGPGRGYRIRIDKGEHNDRFEKAAPDRNRDRFRVSFKAAARGPGASIVRVGDSNSYNFV